MAQDDWKSRIIPKEGITTLALGPEAYVETRDPRYVSDAYQYYLQGMGDPAGATVPAATVAQVPAAPIIPQTGGGGGDLLDQLETNAGIDATPPAMDQAAAIAAMTTDDARRGIDTTMPDNLTTDMGAESFVDRTPDYSNVGLTSPKRSAQDIVTRTEPVNLIEQDIGSQHPVAINRGTTITGTRPPDFVAGAQTFTEPVPGSIGNIKLQARGKVTTTPDQVDQSMPPMLGDRGLSMDDMSGALDAPYGVNPDTGVPYETPRSIADQNKELGMTFTEPATTLGGKINSAFENVKGKGTEAIGELRDKLVALGGKVKEGFENIVDFGGTQIDVGKTLATGALNYLGKNLFGPIGSVLGTALEALPPGGPTFQTSKAIEVGLAAPGQTQDKYGINTQSMFGDYSKYNIDRVEELENNMEKSQAKYIAKHGSLNAINEYGKNWEGMNKRNLQELKDRKEYVDRLGDVKGDQPGMTIAEELGLMDKIDPGLRVGQKEEDKDFGLDIDTAVDEFAGLEGIDDDVDTEKTLATDKWNTGAFTDYDIDISEDPDITFEKGPKEKPTGEWDPGVGSKGMDIDTGVDDFAGLGRDDKGGFEPEGGFVDQGGLGEFGTGTSTSRVSRTDADYGQFGRAQQRQAEETKGGGGGGGGDGCFLKGTPVTMADGSTKAVEQVDLGDNVAKGGKVFATGKFLVDNLHDYKGIKVSGSHMVNEDGNWTRVEDSKHGKPLGDDEHTVYVFGAENRRILINDILFTDYFEVTDQEKLLKYEDKFFDNWKIYANKEDINNINTLNAV